ncbi:MAG: hypothetical protein ACXVHB_05810 [Solirubrobacteraceae bacterium]
MKRVLALDPGDKVGWARADIHDDGTWENVRHGITPLKPMALAVHRSLVPPSPLRPVAEYDAVVMERWALYAHKAKAMIGSEIPSAQFIGMVKMSCWLAGVPCVMQNAAKVNSNRSDVLAPAEASMKKLRPELFELVTQPGAHDDQHDLVALKHLWAYTFDNYPVKVTHAEEK